MTFYVNSKAINILQKDSQIKGNEIQMTPISIMTSFPVQCNDR